MSLDAGRVGVRADQVDIHGRVTSPSFLNELLEDLPEWTDMPVWVNGTEELLPSNNSVPVTSPILTDIAYPDIRRDNQYFTYRESPTPVDGLAKIKSIKGNTLVWNQLVNNGNFANTDNWTGNGTITVSNNTMTYAKPSGWNALNNSVTMSIVTGHKYLVTYSAYVETNTAYLFWTDGTGATSGAQTVYVDTAWKNYSIILTATRNNATGRIPWFDGSNVFTLHLKNYMVIDLTMMGLDSLTLDEVKEWFNAYYPLPYYAYNQGSLLSFNGNGIKTVGKNLFDLSQFANGTITFVDGVLNGTGAQFHTAYGTYETAKKLNCPKGSQITISFDAWTDQNVTSSGNGLIVATYHYDGTSENATVSNAINTPTHFTFQRQDIEKIGFSYGTQGANIWHITNFQVEFGTETSYEPYTSSILSLPISTYFPNGMKSAGTVYDELTPRKATTRIGAVDLGTLNWSYVSADRRFIAIISDAKSSSSLTVLENIVSAKYENATWENILTKAKDKIIALHYTSNNTYVAVIDNDYTDATTFKTAMNGVYLYYELATPVELPTLSLGE